MVFTGNGVLRRILGSILTLWGGSLWGRRSIFDLKRVKNGVLRVLGVFKNRAFHACACRRLKGVCFALRAGG